MTPEEVNAWVWVVVLAMIYFFPAFAASSRRHRNRAAIFMLNLLLGWTFIGWVAALVWAYTNPRDVIEDNVDLMRRYCVYADSIGCTPGHISAEQERMLETWWGRNAR